MSPKNATFEPEAMLRASRWTELFIRERGYSALLSRLEDMLDVEWRCAFPTTRSP